MQVNNCYLLPRDRQLEVPAATCCICDTELYNGERAFFDGDGQDFVCEDCLERWAKELLNEVVLGDDY